MEENQEIKLEPFELVEIKNEELDIERECVTAEFQNNVQENESCVSPLKMNLNSQKMNQLVLRNAQNFPHKNL